MPGFLASSSKDAYEKVVERLLASPRYGERWGRHWMDIWRYSDVYGGWMDRVDNSRMHMWHWRDWIIESVNQDKGYDRMIMEMLAGDEIAPTDTRFSGATGYFGRNWLQVQSQCRGYRTPWTTRLAGFLGDHLRRCRSLP